MGDVYLFLQCVHHWKLMTIAWGLPKIQGTKWVAIIYSFVNLHGTNLYPSWNPLVFRCFGRTQTIVPEIEWNWWFWRLLFPFGMVTFGWSAVHFPGWNLFNINSTGEKSWESNVHVTTLSGNEVLLRLGDGFKYFLFPPLPGEDSQFDEHIFQMGWNHQPVKLPC